MRLGREDWVRLHPDDVAWVTEWQLAAAFPWVPLGQECPVRAALVPDPEGRTWGVEVRAGSSLARARLPVRELARVIHWCYRLGSPGRLLRPPARILAALAEIRASLRPALRGVDPLARMGYSRSSHASGDPAA